MFSKLNKKNVLLFSPRFFNYDVSIKSGLERVGAFVRLYDERPFKSFLGKSILRLNLGWLVSWYISKYFKKIIVPIIDEIDYLVFINPESVTHSLLDYVKLKKPNIKIIVYMWDSFENKKKAAKLVDSCDSFFTFDPVDAKQENVIFLPLFYIPEYEKIKKDSVEIEYDVSFVGTAHSERFKLFKSISYGFSRVFYFLYSPSRIVFLYKKFICGELVGLLYEDVSFSPMVRTEVVDVISKSKAVIDINHPSQVGLTMRTIEVFGAGKKLITTNSKVVEYDFYNPSNILVYNSELTYSDISSFLKKPYLDGDDEIYRNYSLNSWVRRLFDE